MIVTSVSESEALEAEAGKMMSARGSSGCQKGSSG